MPEPTSEPPTPAGAHPRAGGAGAPPARRARATTSRCRPTWRAGWTRVLADLSRARSEAADGTPAGTGSGPVDLLPAAGAAAAAAPRGRRRRASSSASGSASFVEDLGQGDERRVVGLVGHVATGRSRAARGRRSRHPPDRRSAPASSGPTTPPRSPRCARRLPRRRRPAAADSPPLRTRPRSVRAAEAVPRLRPGPGGRRAPGPRAVRRPAGRAGAAPRGRGARQVVDLYLCGSPARGRARSPLPAP